ncbi:uncharacterized protein IWZ02DRAFT_152486 [Phyllosticta citriasiana]|uniref:uncharacterized protein n=1 Tax=Phyllosticta citriasiana TaxID=595635 RepID=UPI0030FDCFC0
MVSSTAPSLFCTKYPNALRSASLASRNHPRAVACRLYRPIIRARHFPVWESLPSGPSRSRSVPAGRLRLGTCIDTRIASTLQTVFVSSTSTEVSLLRLPTCNSSVVPMQVEGRFGRQSLVYLLDDRNGSFARVEEALRSRSSSRLCSVDDDIGSYRQVSVCPSHSRKTPWAGRSCECQMKTRSQARENAAAFLLHNGVSFIC